MLVLQEIGADMSSPTLMILVITVRGGPVVTTWSWIASPLIPSPLIDDFLIEGNHPDPEKLKSTIRAEKNLYTALNVTNFFP